MIDKRALKISITLTTVLLLTFWFVGGLYIEYRQKSIRSELKQELLEIRNSVKDVEDLYGSEQVSNHHILSDIEWVEDIVYNSDTYFDLTLEETLWGAIYEIQEQVEVHKEDLIRNKAPL